MEAMIHFNTCLPTQLSPLSWTWATHDEPERRWHPGQLFAGMECTYHRTECPRTHCGS